MIEEILTAANIPARAGRFPDPPAVHAVYFDSVETDGPDGYNRIFYHASMVELYAPTSDPVEAAALEKELDARSIPYTTQGWYWIQAIQRYQNIYEFSYTVKT